MIAKIKTIDEILSEHGGCVVVNERVEDVVNKVNEIIEQLNSIELGMRTR